MRIVPRVAAVLAQTADQHASELSRVDYAELARWARQLAESDAATGDAARLDAFRASPVYEDLGARARRLVAFAYTRALTHRVAEPA